MDQPDLSSTVLPPIRDSQRSFSDQSRAGVGRQPDNRCCDKHPVESIGFRPCLPQWPTQRPGDPSPAAWADSSKRDSGSTWYLFRARPQS